MKVVMATGKDLKKVHKFLNHDGTITNETIEQHMANNVGGARGTDKLPKATKETSPTAKVQKICLGCSDPAIEGEDYCPSCIKFIK